MEPLALVCDRSPSLDVNRSPRSCEGVRKYLLQVLSSRPKTSTERAFTFTLIQASGTWMYSTLSGSYAPGTGSALQGISRISLLRWGEASRYDHGVAEIRKVQDFSGFATETELEPETRMKTIRPQRLLAALKCDGVFPDGGLHEGAIDISCKTQNRRSQAFSKCQQSISCQ